MLFYLRVDLKVETQKIGRMLWVEVVVANHGGGVGRLIAHASNWRLNLKGVLGSSVYVFENF